MNRAADALKLTFRDGETLESWVSAHNTPQQISLRAQIILLAADGVANARIAEELARISHRFGRDSEFE